MPPTKYIAVFNTNPEGKLIARLITVRQSELTFSGNQVAESSRKKIIQRVQDNLPRGHHVCGVTNLLPSVYGLGGGYVFPVRLKDPEPRYQIEVGPPAKVLNDLLHDDHEPDEIPSEYGFPSEYGGGGYGRGF